MDSNPKLGFNITGIHYPKNKVTIQYSASNDAAREREVNQIWQRLVAKSQEAK